MGGWRSVGGRDKIVGMERPKREEGVKIIRQGDFKRQSPRPERRPSARRATGVRTGYQLERDMCAFLLENLEMIEPGLDEYEDVSKGKEYPCRVRRMLGAIDILAVDRRGGFLVIECKRGAAKATALGQLLGYLGWVQEHLCTSGESARGALVVGRATPMLLYAVRATGLPISVWECPSPGVLRRVQLPYG